jgi:hypothetical protein
MNTAQTGGSLLEEIAVASEGVKATAGHMSHVAGRAAFGSEAGGVLGALGVSAHTANNIRSMFKNSSMASTVATGAATNAGATAAGGKAMSGGIVGALTHSVANTRFDKGLNEIDPNKASYSYASNAISHVARGDTKKTGTLSDNPNAKTSAERTIGSRAYDHYFKQKGTENAGKVSNVTMGGGKVTGNENGKQFEMFSGEHYNKPAEGSYSTVTAGDDSVWYKQVHQTASTSAPQRKDRV